MDAETIRILITAVATLASAALGAAVALRVVHRQYRHQASMEERKRGLAAYEKIHTLLSEIAHRTGYAQLTFHAIDFADGVTLEQTDPGPPGNLVLTVRQLRMFVDLYLPMLSTEVATIEREIQRFVAAALRARPTKELREVMPKLTENMAMEAIKSAKATEEAALVARQKLVAYAATRRDSTWSDTMTK